MKKIVMSAIMVVVGLTAIAQNRWNVYAGGSISHDCGGYFEWNADGDTGFDWGGGAFLGGGYEINFNNHWSITPSVEIQYIDNGVYYNKTGVPGYNSTTDIWTDSWSFNIPVTAGFRFPVSDNVSFKIDGGFYLSEAFYKRQYKNVAAVNAEPQLEKKKASSDFGNDFQLGVVGGVSVETGRHFSYFFRTQYPFLKDRWSSKTITLAIGVKYSF
ncbi:MAG: PorT family protein [Muribaculaceae bacterium]|nr:PorT family protein [Muribaculaceae bacterium]